MASQNQQSGWTRRGVLASGLAPFLMQGQRRPNVLFIMPDQLRGQALGCTGDPNVRTPHIDRLASQGVLFRNTLANSPVCCPARAILMTGEYCHTNGMVANDLRLREEHVSIAEVLRGEGYRTGFIGKWHLDGGPRLPGFIPPGERRQGFEHWAANECSHRHFDTHYFRDDRAPIPMPKFEAEGWTDLAIEFLQKSRKDPRPFFLMTFMGPPHDPYGAPEEYMRLYDPMKLTLRKNWKGGPRVPGAKDIAAYYAAVTAVDDQVDRLMKELDSLDLTEDTVVVFTSDHGDMLGSQGLRLKRKPWEESIRIPGIIRYPRRAKKPRGEDALFSHIDMPPTILRLCEAPVPSNMQGHDYSDVILGKRRRVPDSAFLQIFGPYQAGGVREGWRGVRTSRYTYARYQSEPWVLYDLKEDPYQMENLIADPSAAKLLREMDGRVQQWMARTGDSWSFNWNHPVEDNGRLYRHRTFYTVDEYLDWAKENPELDRAGLQAN